MTIDMSSIFDRVVEQFDPTPDPYITDPAKWVSDKLGEHFYSKQQEIAQSVVDNRYTAVHACHDSAKSHAASRLVCWWLDVHPVGDAFAVTTAPTTPQVEAILWREIAAAHRKGSLDGRITLDARWYMGSGKKELVAYGRKPMDLTDPQAASSAFQGIHARYVLVVLDEAGGIPSWLWDAVDTLVTNNNARVLAIGNPDDPASTFEKNCRPGSGWNVIHIGYKDTPNFSGEPVPPLLNEVLLGEDWVEERRQRWGERSNLYISKVLGLFPELSDDVLISPKWIREAIELDLTDQRDFSPGRMAVDVARSGGDETCIYRNWGGHIRKIHSEYGADTHETSEVVAAKLRLAPGATASVDAIGVGAGVYDNLNAWGLPVQPFIGSEKAYDSERYANRRAEQYWELRMMFRNGEVDLDPEDENLIAQLGDIKWKLDPRGRILIESKEDMKKRGVSSPDRADAVMMSSTGGGNYAVFQEIARSRKRQTDPENLLHKRM